MPDAEEIRANFGKPLISASVLATITFSSLLRLVSAMGGCSCRSMLKALDCCGWLPPF